MGQSSTQRQKIKSYLWDRFGQWVPLPEILPFAAQYSARIFELRRELRPKGYEIQNKTETQADGTKHSWFKLDYAAAIDVTPKQPPAIIRKPEPEIPWSERKPVKTDNFGRPISDAVDAPLFKLVQS